jgi:hypothetical protein
METRTQTQETVRNLLNRIIDFNRDKHREYSELGFNIQRDYSLDDYVDMLSYMDNCGNNLYNNEEAINELSDADLLKLEQALKYTTEFIGLSTQNIQWGTGYRAIEADFPTFDYFNFPNPLEFFLYLIDPRGRHIRRLADSSPRESTQEEIFARMTDAQQMEFIRGCWEEGERRGGREKGYKSEYLRNLRSSMKLRELFQIDEPFMNITLREFLNINSNGVDRYTLRDMETSGWSETNGLGSIYHQNTASDRRVTAIIAHNQNGPIEFKWVYNRLNAKFTNTDGREAVFRHPGVYINSDPDRGTFNYSVLRHREFDMEPFKRNPPIGYNPSTHERYNIGIFGNSHYWQY